MDQVVKPTQPIGMPFGDKMMPLGQSQMDDAQREKLRVVANEFEAIFVQQIFKQSRQMKLTEGLFDNAKNESFQTMLDQEYASSMAQTSSLGIAEAMINQLSPPSNVKNVR